MQEQTEQDKTEAYTKYLREFKKYSSHSAANSLRSLKKYKTFLERENLSETQISYTDILKLIKEWKQEGRTKAYVNLELRNLDNYYSFLKKIKKASHNPFLNLRIKAEKRRLPHDILSRDYLEKLYESCKAETPAEKRNKVQLGIMVFQGVRKSELENMEAHEIDLYKGTVYIKGHGKVKARILPLHSRQILLLDEYIRITRPTLVKMGEKKAKKAIQESHRLFISTGGKGQVSDSLREFLKNLQKTHGLLKHFTQIRTSVIVNWLKEKKIREVQYLAGHSHIFSTEIYKQADMLDLKQQLDKYHPLR
jgi:integrase/recombinase XerD